MAKRESCPSACRLLRERRAIGASPSWSDVRYPRYRIPKDGPRQRTFPNGKRRPGKTQAGAMVPDIVFAALSIAVLTIDAGGK